MTSRGVWLPIRKHLFSARWIRRRVVSQNQIRYGREAQILAREDAWARPTLLDCGPSRGVPAIAQLTVAPDRPSYLGWSEAVTVVPPSTTTWTTRLPTEPAAATADDALLVRATRQGDRAAFGLLYSRYARMVHGILLARAPRAEIEDLVQDVFLLAWRHIGKLRDPQVFGNWLAKIARNRAREYFRHTTPPEKVAGEAVSEDPPAIEAARALAAIRSLPDAYRETLVLRLVEGMSGPEIARRTGMTAGSVRVNLHRGMKLLREKLEGERRHE